MNEKKAAIIAVSIAVATVLFVSIFVVQSRRGKDKQDRIAVGNLQGELENFGVALDMETQEFAPVWSTFHDLSERIGRTTVRNKILKKGIDDRLVQVRQKLSEKEKAYQGKLSRGYAMFEGKFISPKEKKAILQEREQKAEEKRRIASAAIGREVEQAEERRQRESEERRQREYKRQEEIRLTAIWEKLYNEIRKNQAIIDKALRSPDAWMHANQLEELAQLNVTFQEELEKVSRALERVRDQ
jgi:hypothetical protein